MVVGIAYHAKDHLCNQSFGVFDDAGKSMGVAP
jgi:hypothetical protein